MKRKVIGAICLSAAASLWGGMYVVSKYVLDYIPPLTLVWLRYIVAFIFLYFMLKFHESKRKNRTPLRKREWMLLAWIGFIGYFVSISLQFIGTKLSDAHTGAIITSATPAFILIFAAVILNEQLNFKKILSVVLATIGVVIVIGWDQQMTTYIIGSIVLIGAAITWALLTVYVKKASMKMSSLTITTYAILFAIVFTTPVMIWELQTESMSLNTLPIILGILYLGIVATAGAFFLWNKGLELMDAGVGSLFFFFQPLVGSFLGWLLLDEELNSNFFIGGFVILLAVFIAIFQDRHTK